MKKSLLVLAVLGATALSANAASVSLYGNLDAGFGYQHLKPTQGEKTNTFKMLDGIASDNFIGLKGVEELGHEMKAGFVLENGFNLTNGSLAENNKLFSREARLFVDGEFGELSFGRMGSLGNGNGSYNIAYKNIDAMNGRTQAFTGFVKTPVLNNAIAYKTPTIGGFTGFAQYSFGVVNQDENKHKDNDRFVAVGATYSIANANLVATFEQGLPGKNKGDAKKPLIVNFGGNMAFDNLTVFTGMQYAKNLDKNAAFVSSNFNLNILPKDKAVTDFDPNDKVLAGTIGAKYAFDNSELSAAGYLARHKDNGEKINVMGLAARYDYNLSSRTALYVGTDMARAKFKSSDQKANVVSVYSGLKHSF